jgi:DNA-binding GntR family transcriptional regulator
LVLKKGNLADGVYSRLRDYIIDGKMANNQYFTEGAIGKDFHVGKATAREALHRLCFDGYMTRYPRKGYLVNLVLGEDYKRVQRMRYAIEGLAVKLIIRHCSLQEISTLNDILHAEIEGSDINFENSLNLHFHSQLGKLANDQNIYDYLVINVGIATRAAMNFPYLQNSPECYSHQSLVNAILERNTDLSLEILRNHLNLDKDGL